MGFCELMFEKWGHILHELRSTTMMVMMTEVRSGVVFKNAGFGGNRRILKWNPSEPLVSLHWKTGRFKVTGNCPFHSFYSSHSFAVFISSLRGSSAVVGGMKDAMAWM